MALNLLGQLVVKGLGHETGLAQGLAATAHKDGEGVGGEARARQQARGALRMGRPPFWALTEGALKQQ